MKNTKTATQSTFTLRMLLYFVGTAVIAFLGGIALHSAITESWGAFTWSIYSANIFSMLFFSMAFKTKFDKANNENSKRNVMSAIWLVWGLMTIAVAHIGLYHFTQYNWGGMVICWIPACLFYVQMDFGKKYEIPDRYTPLESAS